MTLSIAARFEKIAELHTDRPALLTTGRVLTYGCFNKEANRIAHAVGIRSEDAPAGRIALLFEQGEGGILSIFGALKTGHAFVPLDAADGSDRMKNIIADCQPVAILTDLEHSAAAQILSDGQIPIVCVDDLSEDLPTTDPGVTIDPDADAYVFYTSGSTGNPKGVRQTQRNLQHFVDAYSRTLELIPEDRLTLFYSLAFSASNMDVFGALLNGAALYPYDIRKQGTAALGDWLDRHEITILHAVPTVYRHLSRQLPAGRILNTIRGVDLGGEAVYAADVELHRAHFREGCVLINHLAATEASVIAQQKIDLSEVSSGEMLSVGAPADGMEIQVLDADGHPVAEGGTGEIVLCSRYISPGYWQQPELDAKAFGTDENRPGWKTYRSGDLGYFSKDGYLHFLGRKDHRVKVRGHTVDTSEIESAIRASADVRDVAVVLQEEAGVAESAQLVAFLAGDSALNGSLDELRLSLRKLLPSYMIPAAIIVLEKLPTTASGKLDRKTLALMEVRESREGKSYEAPASETEETVAALFGTLLKVERPGRDEDFFLSGGDSLKATLLHAQLEDRFKKSIPLEKLFSDPTVKGIAALILCLDEVQEGAASHPAVLVPLQSGGTKPILFLIHGAKGQAFVSPHFLSILGPDQPVFAYQADKLDRKSKAHTTVENMAREYVKAMREVQPQGPYMISSLCIGYVVAVEMARQLVEAGEKIAPLVMIDPPVKSIIDIPFRKRFLKIGKTYFRRLFLRSNNEEKMMRSIRNRAQAGRIQLDVDNEGAVKAALKTALDFELALYKYRLPVYREDVFILGSAERWNAKMKSRKTQIHKKLTGNAELFIIAETHSEVHSQHNTLFAQQLRAALEKTVSRIIAWREELALPQQDIKKTVRSVPSLVQ